MTVLQLVVWSREDDQLPPIGKAAHWWINFIGTIDEFKNPAYNLYECGKVMDKKLKEYNAIKLGRTLRFETEADKL